MHTSERNSSDQEMQLLYAVAIAVVHTVNTKAMLRTVIVLVFLLMVWGCKSPDQNPCPTRTCSEYTTQAEAQKAFDADQLCLAALDNDNDGIACEQLPTGTGSGTGTGGTGTGSGSGSGCPATAACGCSNKTKAQCVGPCCKWTVGSGCGCK